MPERFQTVCENLQRVQDRIAHAAEQAGRATTDITLVGVSKYVNAEHAKLLAEAGCLNLGESRPQQLKDKAAGLQGLPIRWHQIGHLQRNKVDITLRAASLIHTVDSLRLLSAIETSAAKQNLSARVLLEVNISGDASKHGFMPAEMPAVIDALSQTPHVQAEGLMTMAARDGGVSIAQQNFAALRELRDELQPNAPPGVRLAELSMGMSGDFEAAIAEGATLVRVGSALWQGLDSD